MFLWFELPGVFLEPNKKKAEEWLKPEVFPQLFWRDQLSSEEHLVGLGYIGDDELMPGQPTPMRNEALIFGLIEGTTMVNNPL